MIRLFATALLALFAALVAQALWRMDREHMKLAAVAVLAGGLVAAGAVMILLGD